jgi:hypothetical protein
MDRLYKQMEMKVELEVMKRRLRIQKGQTRKKTLIEEKIENLENKVKMEFDIANA